MSVYITSFLGKTLLHTTATLEHFELNIEQIG